MSQPLKTSLYYTDGSSDKEYHAELLGSGQGFVVNFRYGRRGASLNSGTKTPAPLPYDKALRVYEKLVAEKTGKGYTTGFSGEPYQDTAGAERFTGFSPQLLNPIEEQDLPALLSSAEWVMQQKLDGERRPINVAAGGATGINRRGLVVPLPTCISGPLERIGHAFLVDGEQVGTTYYAFDLLELGGKDLRSTAYTDRLAMLEGLLILLDSAAKEHVRVVYTARRTQEKNQLLTAVKGNGLEGLVFKRASSGYTPGAPNSGGDQLKFKFAESATLIVTQVNGAKRSVGIAGFDETGAKVALGNVTIPPNFAIPQPEAIVEVRYLYAYPNGSLYQPVYLGERTDQGLEACVTSQLKYKADGDAAPMPQARRAASPR